MLNKWEKPEMPEEEEIKERLAKARDLLEIQQLQIKERKLPVLVLFEGWGAAGKGSEIGQIIKNIDPRFFKVASMSADVYKRQEGMRARFGVTCPAVPPPVRMILFM